MNWSLTLFGHILLVSVALALPAKNEVKKKTTVNVTTQPAITEKKNESLPKHDQKIHETEPPKLAAIKRDIPEALVDKPDDFEDTTDDSYEGKSADEYAKVLALGPSLDSSRVENAILKAESFGDPASINEYRYYGGEERRKRTIAFDELLNSPSSRPKRELELTPEEVLALLSFWEQQRLYNAPSSNRWSDDDNSLDMSNSDVDDDSDVYNDRADNGYGNYFDHRLSPHWGNFAKDKRFMVSRRRRSSFLGNPKFRVPILRRAIL